MTTLADKLVEAGARVFELGFNAGAVEELHALCDALLQLADEPAIAAVPTSASLRKGGVAKFVAEDHGIPDEAKAAIAAILADLAPLET